MKNTLKIFGIIFLSFVIGFFMSSCDDDDLDENKGSTTPPSTSRPAVTPVLNNYLFKDTAGNSYDLEIGLDGRASIVNYTLTYNPSNEKYLSKGSVYIDGIKYTFTPQDDFGGVECKFIFEIEGSKTDYKITLLSKEISFYEDGDLITTIEPLIVNQVGTPFYTITFDSQGGASVEKLIIKYEGTILVLPNPEKDDCKLEGWYSTSSYTTGTKWVITNKVKSDITLYAKWDLLCKFKDASNNPCNKGDSGSRAIAKTCGYCDESGHCPNTSCDKHPSP
ncbi:MAG: InlB B-repeat-containing protein [Treponema sp.]|nr:InlB B-repeat-containing protein [Treponema sp.]MCL2272599.1 InlB B-repeat-containing protein [Treponema sp.]